MKRVYIQENTKPVSAGRQMAIRSSGLIPSHLRGEKLISHKLSNRNIDPRLISLLQPGSIESERYRRLRQSVEDARSAESGTVIAITSPLAGDGKSFTAINLAGSLAQNPLSRVLLLELDLRQKGANIKDYLGINNLTGAGIVDNIVDVELTQEECTYYLADFNLYIMPSGSETNLPYEILNSPELGQLIAEARKNYDYVIIDTAPVVLLPDTQLISKWVDGFFMVVGADKTTRKMLEEAFNLMDPNKLIGLVLNGYTPISDKYYRGYY